MRACRPGEVLEAEPQDYGAPNAPCGPQPTCHPVDERNEIGVDRFMRPARVPAGALGADRSAPVAGTNGSRVTIVGERVEVAARTRAEHGRECILGDEREATDRRDSAGVKLPGRDRPDAPEPFDREGVEEFEFTIDRDDE